MIIHIIQYICTPLPNDYVSYIGYGQWSLVIMWSIIIDYNNNIVVKVDMSTLILVIRYQLST